MEYIKLGNSGLDISKICLGGMSFGNPAKGLHNWVLDEENAKPIINKALDLGINFFDTANAYAMGSSEEIMGKVLNDYGHRDELVVASKVYFPTHKGPNNIGLSRKNIMAEIDKSLKRLGMDYLDLYIIHRWDDNTPIEETMAALNDIVKSGKALYLGASSMAAWQFQKAQNLAEKNGWTKFISMQNHYNLLYREEEREMIPYCNSEKIGITPYSPLASGRLTRDWGTKTTRSENDLIAKSKYDSTEETDKLIVEQVAALANKHGVPRIHIALAWLRQKQSVVAPIIGATKISHIEDAVGSLALNLTEDEMNLFEAAYVPHPVIFSNATAK